MKAFKSYSSYRTINNILSKDDMFVSLSHSAHTVNGVKKGFSGFFENKVSKKIIYITTDIGCNSDKVLIRTATSTKDFTGGQNYYAKTDDELLRLAKSLTK